ncbi:peptidyl-tRNA hydrolase [gut metagenome]|uniref:Peptidyl-tRNA hydrolase n=1 Tax=gut metagenome TaxID=749906 RepID=J9GR55_9ZZZZ
MDFVLGEFPPADLEKMDERLEMAGEMVKSFALSGIQFTMNHFNKK